MHPEGITLRDLVARYRAIAGQFGAPVALEAFGLSPEQTETVFSGYDEDYHISRFLHFISGTGTRFVIDGEPVTHVSIDPEIASIL
jgi:hypothetical protein